MLFFVVVFFSFCGLKIISFFNIIGCIGNFGQSLLASHKYVSYIANILLFFVVVFFSFCGLKIISFFNIIGCIGNFGQSLLASHNRLRARHGSPPLKWSSSAAAKAKEWANHLAQSGQLQHGNHQGMGQNLAYKSGPELTADEVANMWYQEISNYDFNQPGFRGGTGHFTQMVWADTTHMGSAKVSRGNQSYVVANYTPPGNITNEGQFQKNVKRPK